ncbi:hypothetical protein [Bradyrhizobium sp.]|jgi:hypothetical protein|uniref:hypothetical protein n=1 Tax=Bradyrhizobium sp. TaxID=376 RepID=UPI002C317F35|nr:hypothetical protein [Bradyrhizobium sp.]HWX61148.1 hypothetical protein [Bradyrhizobium sp.]
MIPVTVLMSTLAVVGAARAQQFYQPAPGASRFDPPVPVPPGPKITVPVIPKMDELPSRNYVTAPTRPSFGERFSGCLDAGAAAGLGPNARAQYAGGCANRD